MLHPDTILYDLAPDDEELVADWFMGAHVMRVALSGDSNGRVTALSLRLSDGRTLHFAAIDGGLAAVETGLAGA